jgi:hypothetical protein
MIVTKSVVRGRKVLAVVALLRGDLLLDDLAPEQNTNGKSKHHPDYRV